MSRFLLLFCFTSLHVLGVDSLLCNPGVGNLWHACQPCYLCEQIFSHMKHNLSPQRSCLTTEHLESCVKLKVTNYTPDIEILSKAVQGQGNGQEHASSTISDHLNTTITLGNNGSLVQDSETNLPLNKITESVDGETTKLKLEENTTTIHSSQNSSLYTTVASPNITTVSTSATESTAKQIPYTAVSPTKASVNSASTTAAAFPNPGKWMVNETDKICIIVQMAVQFNVSYIDASNKTSFEVFDLPIDNTTTTNGSCGKLEQEIKLMWSSQNGTNNGTMTLHFIRKENDTDYSLHHLNVTLPRTDFPKLANKSNSVELMYEPSDFKARLSNSYKCMKQQRLYLIQNNNNITNITNITTSYLTISDLRFQAFRTDNSTVLGLAENCVVDTEDIVPIAVGCILAGLVFIVLIAYLIGRRRNRALGYFSV